MRTFVVLAAATLLVIAWLSGGFGLLAPAIAPARCTVGLNGAAVSVTVQGPGAMAQCDSFLAQTTNGGTWYVYAPNEVPTAPIVCQVNVAGVVVDVRDSGLIDAYGNEICQNLFKMANGQPLPSQ